MVVRGAIWSLDPMPFGLVTAVTSGAAQAILGRMRAARGSGAAAMSATAGPGMTTVKVKMRTADGYEIKRKWKRGEYEEKVKRKPGRYGYRY